MNNLQQWQQNNDEYLTKALSWLRLSLKRQIKKLEQVQEIRQPKETLPTKHHFSNAKSRKLYTYLLYLPQMMELLKQK